MKIEKQRAKKRETANSSFSPTTLLSAFKIAPGKGKHHSRSHHMQFHTHNTINCRIRETQRMIISAVFIFVALFLDCSAAAPSVIAVSSPHLPFTPRLQQPTALYPLLLLLHTLQITSSQPSQHYVLVRSSSARLLARTAANRF